MENQRIRIVIPVLNNCMLTAQAVYTARREAPEAEIVIVDNGSDDDTLAVFRADTDSGGRIQVISNPERGAYSKSVNMGAVAPGAWDVLIVTNNDVIFAPGSISALVGSLGPFQQLALPTSPRCAASAGITPARIDQPRELADVYSNADKLAQWWERYRRHFRQDTVVRWPYVPQGGYCFAVTHAMWELLRGFDEDYDLFGEDYDLFARAQRHTHIVKSAGSFVDHLEHQTTIWMGTERDVRMCRNRFRLAEKQEGIKELVSIILPTYNRTESLMEAIDSVLIQTMPHWRLYVIDDGSKDWDRIQVMASKRYRGHENRMWFFHRQENEGPGAARNAGLALARGKYIAFLDSDDIWYAAHLETHIEAHEHSLGLAMSYSETDFAWRWFNEEAKRYSYRREVHPESQLLDARYSPERLAVENFIKTSAVVIRADAIRDPQITFPVERDHQLAAEDWAFFRSISAAFPTAIRHIPKQTARTHWAKNPQEEAHHSSRLNAWADFKSLPSEWLCRHEIDVGQTDMPVTVVVPTHRRPDALKACLASLPETAPVVIGCDGRQSREYAAALAQQRPLTGLVSIENARGPSYARNRAVEAVQTPWVWFLDDDDLALPGAYDAVCLATLRAESESTILLFALVASTECGKIGHVDGVYTSGIVMARSLFDRVGGFDEDLAYAEERQLLQRAEACGARQTMCGTPVALKTTGARAVPYSSPGTGSGVRPVVEGPA